MFPIKRRRVEYKEQFKIILEIERRGTREISFKLLSFYYNLFVFVDGIVLGLNFGGKNNFVRILQFLASETTSQFVTSQLLGSQRGLQSNSKHQLFSFRSALFISFFLSL